MSKVKADQYKVITEGSLEEANKMMAYAEEHMTAKESAPLRRRLNIRLSQLSMDKDTLHILAVQTIKAALDELRCIESFNLFDEKVQEARRIVEKIMEIAVSQKIDGSVKPLIKEATSCLGWDRVEIGSPLDMGDPKIKACLLINSILKIVQTFVDKETCDV
jgi:hypothetical protein